MLIRWLIGFCILFAVFTIMSNIIEYNDPMTADDATVWSDLTSFQTIEAHDDTGAIFAGAGALWGMVKGVWRSLWFDYSFLRPRVDSNGVVIEQNFLGVMVRYILFIPCTVGMFFTIALAIRSALVVS